MVKGSRIPPRKQWARLVTDPINTTDVRSRELRLKLREALQEATRNVSNIVLGSEEFDRFGLVPWSHRDGRQSLQHLVEWTQSALHSGQSNASDSKLYLDVVVNYRTPRSDQWISIWKQLMSFQENRQKTSSYTYPEWICQPHIQEYNKVWEYLDCVSNPLGLVHSLTQYFTSSSLFSEERIQWRITLIDMGGVSQKGLDIAHVSACDILGIPCTNGWVRGINRTLQVNAKSRPLGDVSSLQLNELEWLLRQRDCAFQQILEESVNIGQVSILYKDSLWATCPARSFSSTHSDARRFLNTSYLLRLMQSQFRCQPVELLHLNLTQFYISSSQMNAVFSANKELESKRLVAHHETNQYDWAFIQILQWCLIGSLLWGVLRVRYRRRNRVALG